MAPLTFSCHCICISKLINRVYQNKCDEKLLKTSWPQWEPQHLICCVKHYYKCRSYKQIRKIFFFYYKRTNLPSKLIYKTEWRSLSPIEQWRTLTWTEDRLTNSRRPRKHTQEVIHMVWEFVEQRPEQSLCRRSQSLGISTETYRRIIKDDLKKYPYRIQTKLRLTAAEKIKGKVVAD